MADQDIEKADNQAPNRLFSFVSNNKEEVKPVIAEAPNEVPVEAEETPEKKSWFASIFKKKEANQNVQIEAVQEPEAVQTTVEAAAEEPHTEEKKQNWLSSFLSKKKEEPSATTEPKLEVEQIKIEGPTMPEELKLEEPKIELLEAPKAEEKKSVTSWFKSLMPAKKEETIQTENTEAKAEEPKTELTIEPVKAEEVAVAAEEPKAEEKKSATSWFKSILPVKKEAATIEPTVITEPTPVAEPTPVVVTPAPQATPAPQEDTFLTNIFEKKDGPAQEESKLIRGLIENESKQVEKKKILGDVPDEIDTKMFIDIEYHLKKKMGFLKNLTAVLMVASLVLGAFAYFSTEKAYSDIFANNIGIVFETKNENLQTKQTSINKLRYENLKNRMDEYLYYGSIFLDKYYGFTAAESEDEKTKAQNDLDEARKNLATSFDSVVTAYNFNNYKDFISTEKKTANEAESYFNSLLRQALIADTNNANAKALLSLIEDPAQKIVASKFVNKKSADLKDEDYLSSLKIVSDRYRGKLGSFYKFKNSKIKWTNYLNELNAVTARVDNTYRPELFASSFTSGNGLKYTGFNIENESTIKISGIYTSVDPQTFTVLANLIDELNNKDGAFTDADMRTFNKTKAGTGENDEKYTSNFVITAKFKPDWSPVNN